MHIQLLIKIKKYECGVWLNEVFSKFRETVCFSYQNGSPLLYGIYRSCVSLNKQIQGSVQFIGRGPRPCRFERFHRRALQCQQILFTLELLQEKKQTKTKRVTYSNSMPKARARLGAGSTYVVTHTGVLTGCTVEVCNWTRAVCPWKSSGPGWIGACRGSGCAKIRLSTVAIQDWCAENKAGYEARS